MGKFQLNKKGEDPIKIYEDVFKIAEGTVETHLDKLGKQTKPIASQMVLNGFNSDYDDLYEIEVRKYFRDEQNLKILHGFLKLLSPL